MGAHPMLGVDPGQLAGASVDRSLVRRVWRFARPYRWMLLGYLAIIVVTALVQLVPPLLFRSIIDSAIPDGDRAYLNLLAGLAVLAAFAGSALAVADRYVSSRIGEGVIYDLRVA
ncbi:MAG: ABC transporter ATP-binding protein, partial [Candidatus Limnocylindrales bacterium]